MEKTQREQAEHLIDRILKAFDQMKPADISAEAVARTIEHAAERTLKPGSPMHQQVVEAVKKLRQR